MVMMIYELVGGGDVALDEDGITSLWSGKEPNTVLFERVDGDDALIVGEFSKIVTQMYDHIDMRPKKPRLVVAADR